MITESGNIIANAMIEGMKNAIPEAIVPVTQNLLPWMLIGVIFVIAIRKTRKIFK